MVAAERRGTKIFALQLGGALMILRAGRLTLRPLQSSDVEAVASYSTKPEFIRFLPLPPQTMESAAQFVGQPLPTVSQIPKEIGFLPSRSGKNQGSSALYASAFAQRNTGKATSAMQCIQTIGGRELPPKL